MPSISLLVNNKEVSPPGSPGLSIAITMLVVALVNPGAVATMLTCRYCSLGRLDKVVPGAIESVTSLPTRENVKNPLCLPVTVTTTESVKVDGSRIAFSTIRSKSSVSKPSYRDFRNLS